MRELGKDARGTGGRDRWGGIVARRVCNRVVGGGVCRAGEEGQ